MAFVMELARALEGRWRVERVSGLLPPFGLYKEIRGLEGKMYLGPLRIASFDVASTPSMVRLLYRIWPLRDELMLERDGTWSGRGFIFGREFCRFRFVPVTEHRRLPRRPERRLPVT